VPLRVRGKEVKWEGARVGPQLGGGQGKGGDMRCEALGRL
jgi:hypothetical protein